MQFLENVMFFFRGIKPWDGITEHSLLSTFQKKIISCFAKAIKKERRWKFELLNYSNWLQKGMNNIHKKERNVTLVIRIREDRGKGKVRDTSSPATESEMPEEADLFLHIEAVSRLFRQFHSFLSVLISVLKKFQGELFVSAVSFSPTVRFFLLEIDSIDFLINE